MDEAPSAFDKEPPEGGKLYLTQIAPRREKDMSAAQIAAEIGMDPKEVEDLIATWETPICVREGPQLFADVKEALRAHYYMEEPWHYTIAALFILQSLVALSLPVVFYLFFGGAMGSGKTNALGLIAKLTNGLSFENVSVAALARSMEKGRTVCIDEYDVSRGKEVDEVRDALVRQGYKRDSAPFVRWDAARKAKDEIPIFGPKALTFRKDIDEALQSRGFLIPTVKVRGKAAFDFVRKNLWLHLEDLPNRLDEWGRIATHAFPDVNLEAIAYSPEFEAKVEAVLKELGANRAAEIVTIALLVAEMAGIDVLADLREANALREIASEASASEDREELLEVLADLTRSEIASKKEELFGEVKIVRVRQKEVFEEFNRRKREHGEKPIWRKAFVSIRREAGITEAWIRDNHGSYVWNLPVDWVKENLLAPPVETIKEPPIPPAPSESAPVELPIFYHGKEVVVRNVSGEPISPKRLHDEIAWRVRNHPDEPASLIRNEIWPVLQASEDADMKAMVEGYIEALRAMQTWPELPGGSA